MKGSTYLYLLLLLSNSVSSKTIELDAQKSLNRLLKEFDRDGDKKITVQDKVPTYRSFELSPQLKVSGVYHLSNLLQELKLQTEDGAVPDKVETERIFENPVDRISRLIKDFYWEGLTRRIDKEHLKKVMPDSKIHQPKMNILYVPESDEIAKNYYQQDKELILKFVPKNYDLDFLKGLRNEHGLLSLKLQRVGERIEGVPYVVPGGRFNEMYGWDSYFHVLGLLQDEKVELAKALVDNFVYEITHYGKILNANRSYYLSRSQPPFLTSMILAVYPKLPKTSESKTWLKESVLAAIREYSEVWMKGGHITEMGLNRYYGEAPQIPPEVEPGHFKDVLAPYAKKYKLTQSEFQRALDTGKINEPGLKEYFIHDQAVRESGHDTTYRWTREGKDECSNYVTVDLNSLLYKTELDLSRLLDSEFNGRLENFKSDYFLKQAASRKVLIKKYLWEEGIGFSDYNWKKKERSHYQSATNLYPLWAGLVNKEEIDFMLRHVLPQLEVAGGVAATSLESIKNVGGKLQERQWDYPYGWAPHQIIIWQGLKQNGLHEVADRLIYKWLYMITKNAMDYNGTIPEKYDVVKRSHKVFAEYGNVGTKFSYISREGFGWMNASYQLGLELLSKEKRKELRELVPPKN
ncbi:trehalase family glycosidase [Peredibacter starrii]|uniref:Trehalase family glycosidase n=1 Tax=Peredibacter starrii TaxID=28202 RepID=A0AAX4HPI6_9BACT|nr:trehalase family glycosidase [Peredibacter starrii]WPU65070.1 trehalase family glycosidase [Peredibacter starrii]